MATVYRAEDLKHARPVAIKVLRPELAAALGRERFLREVTTTAGLRHPHILPLFDSGDATGFLFYVMPLVNGESLQARLARERQLPLDDALRIVREVADALDYAHTRDIVHRDIKPANILLENGHAVVADFGIARAITAAADSETLTETGLRIGTPLYMSPEQAAGDTIDGRSDQYALGCVLYEMLAGEPPFSGRTAQAIMARHLTDPVPPLSTVRAVVPVHVGDAISRALAKSPADRFATVTEFAAALDAKESPVVGAPGRRPRRRGMIAGAAVGILVLALGVHWFPRAPSAPLDGGLMAVLPFRLTGTDTTHSALRDGMVDFMEAEFSGASGTRIVPARTVIAASHGAARSLGSDLTEEDARRLARRLGAGSVLLGTIVATPGHLVISGSLLETGTGRVRAKASVNGPADSLQVLVDRFAAQLAAAGAGERPDRLASLTSTSLPALFAYLGGKSAYRAGQYDSALARFGRALELDSTFAGAALGYARASGWSGGEHGRAIRIARAHRDDLSPRDQAFLDALTGPRYPAVPTPAEDIESWRVAVQRYPDDPDLWTYLGDAYVHEGTIAEVDQPLRRAGQALSRAVALDSTLNAEPIFHLLQITEWERDTAAVRRLIARLPADFPGLAMRRLQAGAVLHDTAMILAARQQFDSTADGVGDLVAEAQAFGIAIPEAERAAAVYLARLIRDPDAVPPQLDVFVFYYQLGRPAAAGAVVAALGRREASNRNLMGMIIALTIYGYYGADTTAAGAAAAHLAGVPGDAATCASEWWRLSRGDTRGARSIIAGMPADRFFGCSLLLDAVLAGAEHRPNAGIAYERLDSLLNAGGGLPGWTMEVARWRESQGDRPGALRAVRRRGPYARALNLAHMLREEGRLAALVGDRAGALDAYSQYLALRHDPERSVKPEVDRVRAEVARLVAR